MKRPLLPLIVLISVTSSVLPTFAADVIDASLRMRFNFDAAPVNNVIVDTSPSATHPGTNLGAIWNGSEGARSGVMDFKAPNFNRISIPAIPALNSTHGTINFWIKSSTNTQVQGDFAAMLFEHRTSQGDIISLKDDGTIFVQAWTNYGTANSFSGNAVINDNVWHHVAYVYDQTETGSISIYVDGALDASQANNQAWAWPPSQPIRLGRSDDSYWRVYVGLMDDFQVHNRMLSASEVAATFAGNPVLDSSLVERLNFGAAPVNDVVVDSSASNNSANNQGPAWVSADGGRNGLMHFDPIFNKIAVAPDAEFNSPTGTIAFWIKSTGNTGPGDFASILFDRRTGAGDVIAMEDDGTIFVQPRGGGGQSFATQDSVNDGLWHHVAYVYDQSDTGYIKIYIDGVVSGAGTNSAAWSWPADQQIELGLSHDGYWFGFNGALDEIRFYNRPLTAAEVAIIAPPSFHFSVKPASQTVFVGDDVIFTGSANMTATYQWRFAGTNLPGATSTSLVLTNVQLTNAGTYALVASNNTFGAITSTPAILNINPRPSLLASLVARYNFDVAPVNNVIVDTAPGPKHPGTNLLATWAAAESGHSGVMQFAGGDPGSQIVVPPSPDFDSSKGTIAFWMKTAGNNLNFGDYAAIIFDRRTGDGDVITMVDDGTLFVQAQSHGFHVNQFATTSTVNNDQWHHVAYVYDQGVNGSIRFYIDGQFAASNPNTSPWSWDPAQKIEFGKSDDAFWRRYFGFLDDVQIYNRTLSPAEVGQSMTLPPAVFLTIEKAGANVRLTWPQGTLLEATTITGPYTTNLAVSPYLFPPTGAVKFFKVKVQ